jgi:hypothetical protein
MEGRSVADYVSPEQLDLTREELREQYPHATLLTGLLGEPCVWAEDLEIGGAE